MGRKRPREPVNFQLAPPQKKPILQWALKAKQLLSRLSRKLWSLKRPEKNPTYILNKKMFK